MRLFLRLCVVDEEIREGVLGFQEFILQDIFFSYFLSLNLSHSCDLRHSCCNTRSFNPLCQARDQTHSSTLTRATEVGFLTHLAIAGTTTVGKISFHLWVWLVSSSYLSTRNPRMGLQHVAQPWPALANLTHSLTLWWPNTASAMDPQPTCDAVFICRQRPFQLHF